MFLPITAKVPGLHTEAVSSDFKTVINRPLKSYGAPGCTCMERINGVWSEYMRMLCRPCWPSYITLNDIYLYVSKWKAAKLVATPPRCIVERIRRDFNLMSWIKLQNVNITVAILQTMFENTTSYMSSNFIEFCSKRAHFTMGLLQDT